MDVPLRLDFQQDLLGERNPSRCWQLMHLGTGTWILKASTESRKRRSTQHINQSVWKTSPLCVIQHSESFSRNVLRVLRYIQVSCRIHRKSASCQIYNDGLTTFCKQDYDDFVFLLKTKWTLEYVAQIVDGKVTAPIPPHVAASMIQRCWKMCISTPSFTLCRKRLFRDHSVGETTRVY